MVQSLPGDKQAGALRPGVHAMKNPKYNKPPVVETVLGVQFPEIAAFGNVHFGLYWETIRQRYPKPPQDQPRIAWAVETFPHRLLPAGLNLRLSDQVPQRMWFTAESGSELIQLQPDRFHFNWRGEEGKPYPSYRVNSRKFFDEFERFEAFCEKQGWERPKPSLAEVTYVNHLLPVEGETSIDLFQKAFLGIGFADVAEMPCLPERAVFNRVYPIEGDKGRLYVEATLAQKRDRTEFVLLKMTARVLLPPSGAVSLADGLQKAHDWVVGGFAAVTRPEIQQQRWERNE